MKDEDFHDPTAVNAFVDEPETVEIDEDEWERAQERLDAEYAARQPPPAPTGIPRVPWRFWDVRKDSMDEAEQAYNAALSAYIDGQVTDPDHPLIQKVCRKTQGAAPPADVWKVIQAEAPDAKRRWDRIAERGQLKKAIQYAGSALKEYQYWHGADYSDEHRRLRRRLEEADRAYEKFQDRIADENDAAVVTEENANDYESLRKLMLSAADNYYTATCAWGLLDGENGRCDVTDSPISRLVWDHLVELGSLPGSWLRRGKTPDGKRVQAKDEWRAIRNRRQVSPCHRFLCPHHNAIRTAKQASAREAQRRANKPAGA